MSMNLVEGVLDGIDTILAWMQQSAKMTTSSYCELQTADGAHALASHEGALVSMIELNGVSTLVGQEEFKYIHDKFLESIQSVMSRPGHSIQTFFSYDKDEIINTINNHLEGSIATSKELQLDLDDLFQERLDNLSGYCSAEQCYLVIWTKPNSMSKEEFKKAADAKNKLRIKTKFPPVRYTQNIMAAFDELRDKHNSFVNSIVSDLTAVGVQAKLLDVHDAVYRIRRNVDPDFTAYDWKPVLPGDKYNPKLTKHYGSDISDILWPALSRQLFPRDGENLDMRRCKIGNRIYASVFIDLFPKDIKAFGSLFNRTIQTDIAWRISFLTDSSGMNTLTYKRMLSSVLAFSSAQNRLINDAVTLLDYIQVNEDDAVVKLRVAASTWVDEKDEDQLTTCLSQLSQAIQGWGSCDVSEVCGDAFDGNISTLPAITSNSVATATVASLSDVIYMLPIYRPSSPWKTGSLLFRSPDGKLLPYQPGSPHQTTWIDLLYARPGSGKSVLSNAINLSLILSKGLKRLPRISVIDIGPSSSGLISLIEEALPFEQKHLVAYHRLKMNENYAINVFDTQLGLRTPLAQERAFLVNFISLLATPLGSTSTYDGVTAMIGMVIDEVYKGLSDGNNPNSYQAGVEDFIDGILQEIGFHADQHTTWWEITDALFSAGFKHEAMLAQRHAVPLMADLANTCRSPSIEDLYGKVKTPTGENLIEFFNRMLSSAIREFPILSCVTKFDIGDARIISLDLDEVAKGGGVAGDHQTAVMYMLSRYVVGKNFYLNAEVVQFAPTIYQEYHETRVSEIREDSKRLVYDEFHRTASATAVRDQVIIDMREGRKWNVQVGLISQSLDDFDKVMVEFGTSVFILDAGPEQAIARTSEVFGLSETAKSALRRNVRGPREGGSTMLALFATKESMHTQLLTLTLGPVELWAFSTTAGDAIIRDELYSKIGPKDARKLLARIFPSGSATKLVAKLIEKGKQESGMIEEEVQSGVLKQIIDKIIDEYTKNPDFKKLLM